jgi:hypothetical protein
MWFRDSRMMFFWSCLDCGYSRRAVGPPPRDICFWRGRMVPAPLSRVEAPGGADENSDSSDGASGPEEEEEEQEDNV